jgi:beta-glucosidase
MDDITRERSGCLASKDGFAYRDLNKNGVLDVYEDPRQGVEARVEDLLARMTLEEKAGLLFINGAMVNDDGSLEDKPGAPPFPRSAARQVADQGMSHFNLWQAPGAAALATWHNALQLLAEGTRLGIPATIASDPRNHFTRNIFSMAAADFSQWCEPLGFGALDDAELVRRFAEIVRREYLAVGIRVALHPQLDLATEPRWPRISGCFGEDALVAARLGEAYILGFQGEKLGARSVACMAKHFPGGGPQLEGLDPHFEFQKGQAYPGGNFDYHLGPFESAIAAGTAAIMPYYGVPVGQTEEDVAMSFNKAIVTGLLRERYGYEGIVCTDWGLITDTHLPGGALWPARAWGVEKLSETDRVLKALEAGVDQFGGESCPEHVVELVKSGRLSQQRLDQSVRRLLRLKFQLGLFDAPFVDEEAAARIVGDPESAAAGGASQRRAMVLLKNEGSILPMKGRPEGAKGRAKVFVKNIDPEAAARYAQVVGSPEEADFAILRLDTPWIPVDTKNPFALGFHHGDLDFKLEAKEEILALLRRVPTIVAIYLDRPAVIPEIAAAAKALLGDFGASDEAVLDVVFGLAEPEGRLPFELPSSMEAVRRQKPDLPHDSEAPLYPYGFGLSY